MIIWRRLSPRGRSAAIAIVHLAVVMLVGIGDNFTGPDIEFRLFYLLPVLSAGWLGGRLVGVVIAGAAAVSFFVANDVASAVALKGVPLTVWNSGTRLVTYLVVAVLASLARERSDALRAKTEALLRESAVREEYIELFVHELRHSAAASALAVASLIGSPALTEEERRYLGHLRDQARDLEQLAGQLLAVGRLEGPELALNLVDLDLRELVSSTVNSSPERERLDVRAPAAPVPARADPEELGRALDNYVRNALAYSPKTTRVAIDVVERDGRVGIDVSDSGVGFAPTDAARLFKKYGRLDRKGGRPGAGLGLYLARLIVEAHGGTVHASSPGPGGGARFGFVLPRARA